VFSNICHQLGPLDPDWFEALTAQTNDGNVSDQDDLCANQEGHFKAPFDKTAIDSQLFSTPKVFRHSRIVSPETEDEQWFTETPPWMATQSPNLFHNAKEGYAKNISESLGAQIHHDMSWTSSLNTPPAIPSTLILSKQMTLLFVRKLFPSLSNASKVGVHPECHTSPQSSLNQRDFVWRQKLPDAIEDGEIRRTVASVLDGAEDVLSLFFTNSSSALRKVKTDRIKRKQIIPTKELGSSSTDILTSNNAASSEQRTADQEPGRLPSPPLVKTGDIGITQWSPLSLSEIPPCTVDTSCRDNSPATQMENNISTEQLQNDFDSGQLVRPPVKIRDYGFTKKKRKFVYTVETLDPQVLGKDTQSQKMDSSPVIPDSGQEVNVKHPPSVQAKVQDLDISQLSRDFAQDFSQMSDSGKLSEVAGDTPRNGFSPSACLSAMKQANQKGTVSDSGFQSAVADISCVTASSFVLPSSKNNGQSQQWTGFKTDIHWATPFPSTKKGNGKAQSDDILQEAETDAKQSSAVKESQTVGPGREIELPIENKSTQLISSAKITVDNINCIPLNGQIHGSLPEKTTVSLPSIHASGFKTASNKGIQISSANMERAKHLFEDTKVESFSDQPIKCAHGTEDKLHKSHGSVKNPTSNSNQPSSSENFVDSSCHLTASQKADVTELCTLLEEADSQFEFTQFKTAKLKQHCQDTATSAQKVDKELDPDFLTGIDFDDSFNSDGEQHLAVTVIHDKITLVSDGKPNPGHTETSKLENKNPLMLGVGFKTAGGNVLRVSKKCLSKARALFADLDQNLVTSQKFPDKLSSETDAKTQQKRSVDNHTGNFLHHKEDNSKFTGHGNDTVGCFSTMTVFSDRPVTGKRVEVGTNGFKNNKMETTNLCQSGFQMASGKGISISAKAMQEADAFFKDCDVTESNVAMSVKQKKNIEPFELSNGGGFCTASGEKVFVSADAMKKAEDIHTPEDTNKQLKQKDALRTGYLANQIQVSPPTNGGFQTASGRGVAISAAALKKARSLLSQCDEVEDKIGVKPTHSKMPAPALPPRKKQVALKKAKTLLSEYEGVVDEIGVKPTHSKMPVPALPPRNCGFLAASGKPVAFSSEALQKAKALFSNIRVSAEIPAVSDTRKSEHKDARNDTEKNHCGFTTAGGA
uniref:Uncharacterized protein n=1 Tax=Dicentrarchus labrax TaxID=13489 RepID=A0A8C4HI88_DICLA